MTVTSEENSVTSLKGDEWLILIWVKSRAADNKFLLAVLPNPAHQGKETEIFQQTRQVSDLSPTN